MPAAPLATAPSTPAAFAWPESYYLLLGGVALFLLGVHLLSEGLKRVLGGRLRWALSTVAKNPVTALGAGVAFTGPMQSSGPTTVVLMGLVDASIVTLSQAAVILLGAMVGGTVVPQLLAFPVAKYGLLAVIAGIPLIIFGRWQVWRSVGVVLSGFGLMFYGMSLMTGAVEPLRSSPEAAEALTSLAGKPLLAALAGAAVTAVIQSSGAAVALVMSLAASGVVPAESTLPLVIGINIGTVTPAVIGSLGAGREGRRLVAAYVGFKVLGGVLLLPFAGYLGHWGAQFTENFGGGGARTVANLHTAYNLLLALIFIVPAGKLAAIFAKVIPSREGKAEQLTRRLSTSLSAAPSAALLAAEHELSDMGGRTARLLREGLAAVEDGSSRRIESLKALDDEIDAIYVTMSSYVSRLGAHGLTPEEAARSSRTLHVARLFEEIGDLVSRDLARLAAKRASKDLEFSMESQAALRRFGAAAVEDLERISRVAGTESPEDTGRLAATAQEIEDEHRRLVAAHFEQLGRGVAAAGETGSVYPDTLAVIRDIRRATAEIARVVGTKQ